jgi:hypothetical protein
MTKGDDRLTIGNDCLKWYPQTPGAIMAVVKVRSDFKYVSSVYFTTLANYAGYFAIN